MPLLLSSCVSCAPPPPPHHYHPLLLLDITFRATSNSLLHHYHIITRPSNFKFFFSNVLNKSPAAFRHTLAYLCTTTTPASSTMRAFALLLATIFAAILGNTSALTDAGKMTTVTTKAVASDERTSGSGCSPDGCIPDNTRDGSRDANSRWSCVSSLISGVGGCRIEYNFEDPQDIVKVRIAFHKGDENVRVLNVIVDGSFHSQITSSGETLGYQNFLLRTEQTSRIIFRLADHAEKTTEWLAITEVKFMV